MTDHTVKLAGCTLNETRGLPEALAAQMGKAKLGTTYTAIVELRTAELITGFDHDPVLKVKVLEIEVAQEQDTRDLLTELKRSIHRSRRPEQLDIDSIDEHEETEAEIVRRGQAVISCTICLHGRSDERIAHAPDAPYPTADEPDDWCEWKTCGHPVQPGDEFCPRDHATTGTAPEGAPDDEQGWSGDEAELTIDPPGSLAEEPDYQSGTKAEWVDYAISKGALEAQATGATKAELIRTYGTNAGGARGDLDVDPEPTTDAEARAAAAQAAEDLAGDDDPAHPEHAGDPAPTPTWPV